MSIRKAPSQVSFSDLGQFIHQSLSSLLPTLPQACQHVASIALVAGVSLSATMPAFALGTGLGTGAAISPQKLGDQRISQRPPKVEITLVSYAVTKEAYNKIIPLFAEKWKRETGQEVVINGSFAGSASQSRAVIDGLEADVVQLALSFDVDRIRKAGLIDPGWENESPNSAIVTRSVIGIVTRPGNPKKIKSWQDLARPEVRIISANPKTSGIARWNFLGLWGSVTQTGGTEAQAKDYVAGIFSRVPVLAKDAREASDIFFKQQQGDALLNYENELILAGIKGERGGLFVTPQVNISIEAPVAVVDKVVNKRGTREVAEAFVKFLYTPEAQREFTKVGFRSVNQTVINETEKKFPKITKLYTVRDLGGWDAVQKKFFDDGAIFDQIQSTPR